ncbi:MAG: hypothetical protein SFU98_12310 [Leptospiraceae bacterium]|nr:hypothetical protein [Leptospiraceae bacterium]
MKKIFIISTLVLLLFGCESKKKDNSVAILALALGSNSQSSGTRITDSQLYAESVATSLQLFPTTPSTPFNSNLPNQAHGTSILMKLNSTARSSIDATTKTVIGGSFAENSLIVKERYSAGKLIQIISMKKSKSAVSTWFWGEYSPTGSIEYSVNNNGSGCTGCHLSGKDYVRILEY